MLVVILIAPASFSCLFDRQIENTYHITMGGHTIIIKIFIFLIPLAALTLSVIYLYERKKGKKVTHRFREFSKKYKKAIVNVVDQCPVKQHLLQPPTFNVIPKLASESVAA